MEEKMKKICEGTTTKNDVVHECIEQYRDMFIRASQQTDVLQSVSIPAFFSPTGSAMDANKIRKRGNTCHNREEGSK
jgi:hypothetical protein